MLRVVQHTSKYYGPRTYANAGSSDITIAIAVDYSTAGERLTHKAAGDKYLMLPMADGPVDNARKLWSKLNTTKGKTINVAGNGIYTLSKHGITQEQANLYVYSVLSKVYEYYKFDKIISGGQTGIDLAGGVAGYILGGVDVEMLLPKGYIQRTEDKIDREHTEKDIITQVKYYAGILKGK